MKKILNPKNLPVFVTVAGLLGFLVRLWTLSGGVDAENLIVPRPAAWAVLWVLTVLVGVLIIVMARPLSEPVKYSQNFPASPVSAIGTLLGAVAIALAGVNSFSATSDTLGMVTGILGIAGGVLLMLAGYARLRGAKVNFLYHAIPCLFMALRTFNQCKVWSNDSQLSPYLFTFLFHICAMLAIFQLCTFDVDLGKRRTSLFWSLMTAYLCLVALPTTDNLLFCGCIAIWMLTNLCSLRPAKKRKPANQEPVNPVQAPLSGYDVSMDEINAWLEEE